MNRYSNLSEADLITKNVKIFSLINCGFDDNDKYLENINLTNRQCFLLHKSSIKLLFCKATNIIAEKQKVGNP